MKGQKWFMDILCQRSVSFSQKIQHSLQTGNSRNCSSGLQTDLAASHEPDMDPCRWSGRRDL